MLALIQLVLEILIPLACFSGLVYVIKIISDNRVRRKLNEKGVRSSELNFLWGKRPVKELDSDMKYKRSRIFLRS